MRRSRSIVLRFPFAFALALALVVLMVACSDDQDACHSAACTPASPGSPTFAGVTSASPDRTGERARLTWVAATDDKTAADQIRYRVYASVHQGRALFNPPLATTSTPGALSMYISLSPANVMHYVVVRAVDADNNEDGNAIEKSVLATGDTTPPTFAGIKSSHVDSVAGGLTLTWDPASDDRTVPEGMRYVVLPTDGSAPLAVVEAGRTTVTLPASITKGSFVVRAVDAADNSDANTVVAQIGQVSSGGGPTPPTFAGCHADPLGSKHIKVSWTAATAADGTLPAAISYEVFLSTAPQGETYTAAPTKKVTGGAVTTVLDDLTPATTYYVVCRARDASGTSDTNTAESMVTTTANVTAPTYAGGAVVVDAMLRTASVTWAAATDDATSPDKIVYAVYVAQGTTGSYDFKNPFAVSAPGVLSTLVSSLPSRAMLRFIVRARDLDYNEDQNLIETMGTTNTSFAVDVVPLFAQNCAVVGCHIAPVSMGGMSLSAFNVYEQIVGVNAGERPLLMRVNPGDSTDSYIYQKVTGAPGIAGNPMPAPGTGNILSADQKDIIKSWIDEGAPRN